LPAAPGPSEQGTSRQLLAARMLCWFSRSPTSFACLIIHCCTSNCTALPAWRRASCSVARLCGPAGQLPASLGCAWTAQTSGCPCCWLQRSTAGSADAASVTDGGHGPCHVSTLLERKKYFAPALARVPWALAPLPAVCMRWGSIRRALHSNDHDAQSGRRNVLHVYTCRTVTLFTRTRAGLERTNQRLLLHKGNARL
jgi:hypothetical protein